MREFNNIKPIGSLYEKDYKNRKNNKQQDTKCPIGHLVSDTMSNMLVEIICYCLNPNHYHFILKQLTENGISKFFHKLEMGYAKYFNYKYNRSGSLFQGTFQAKHIDTNEYLLWLSGYVNGNVKIHKIAEAKDWAWSSYQDYLGLRNGTLCEKEIILSQFTDVLDTKCPIGHLVSKTSVKQYQKYVGMIIKESSERKEEIKKCLME